MPLPIANLARRLASGQLRAGDINGFPDVETRSASTVPLVSASATCGFPSPADDHLDRPLDFNEPLVRNPAATFAVRIAGESMTGAGLFPGDFGWAKTVAGLRKARHRGLSKIDWQFTLAMVAYNLVRLPKLIGVAA